MILKEQDGSVIYSDGSAVEQEMLKLAQKYPEEASADAIAHDSRYTINNTFSPVRHNLLNWYPFKADANILEVGAGMGSMTGFLCDVGKTVTAIEMSEARADVIRARFPRRNNLKVIGENVLTWQTNERFDYIVVVGVLEYAGIFSSGEGNAPHVAFMRALQRLLKPGGIVLLAIENRFGLKYWLGGAEDHLKAAFAGIRGYTQGGPKTFSKQELADILQQAGFKAQRFYYVLPDYKFPTAIFTDNYLPSLHALKNISYTYSAGSTLVANEKDLYKDILKNGMFPNMANSYLVEMGTDAVPQECVYHVSARGECKPKYRVVTTIHSDDRVIKKAVDERAVSHVENTYKNGLALQARGLKHIPAKYQEGILTTAFCTAQSAGDVFAEKLLMGDWAAAKEMIDALQTAILSSSEHGDLSSEISNRIFFPVGVNIGPCLEHGYVDLTFYNAFWKEGSLVFYDQEWDVPGIPAKFILYYGLKITYKRNCTNSSIPFEKILQYICVDTALVKVFDRLEEYIWSQVLIRKGDVYGADGYCNIYVDQLTLQAQQSEQTWQLKWQCQRNQQLEHERERLEVALADTNAKLEQIVSSRTWRYGRRLAHIVRKVFRPGSLPTKTVKAALKLWRKASNIPAECARYLKPIVIPDCAQPDVSIIIPVYNEFSYTYDCIRSVVETSNGLDYEVILADDCSTDRTKKAEKIIRGLRVVRNKENLRFLRNCNNAAQKARGRYLLFLNNDTVVYTDWLGSLLRLMESDASIGIAGSKILSPNGTLQEAGGIIWNDASGWNYGRGGDPSAPEYNYVKEVDYISGCSIMVRADFWHQVGGFDERFAPAYYEDADLAFQARANGYRVVYQPLSVLTHFEGATHGTDLSAGQKKYQVVNQPKFREKWASVLRIEQYAPGQHVLRARDRSCAKKIVLMVDHYIPTFDQDAGSRAIYYYIKLFLTSNYHVILIPDNFAHTEYAIYYEQMGVEVLYGEWYYLNWQQWVAKNAEEIDLIFLHRPHISVKYIDFLRRNTKAKMLYYGADLHFLREMRQYEITGEEALLESSAKWREIELELMRKADCALYPSVVEEAYIKQMDPTINIMTLPMYVLEPPVRKAYDIESREGLLFVGGFNHKPNVDAMLWFVEEVFPIILDQYPDMALHIVGSHPPREVANLTRQNIKVHGFVTDECLDEFYDECRLAVVPLRYGAGMKGKVVEAMEKGLPMVTTDIGAEGLSNSSNMLEIANEADEFAAAVCRLYDDVDRLSQMREAGYDYIEEHFSRDSAWKVLNKAITE